MFASLEGVTKRYGESVALGPVDVGLPDGEISVILGPSGCGKTTLLRVLAGLTAPDEGTVVMDGRKVNDPRVLVPSEHRRIGMVFQESLLWPHLKVRGNIAFPLGPGRTRDPRVAKAAEAAEITEFLDRYPSQLSGGEQRRVSIARAVVAEPGILLLDEPLSGLDANLRVRLLSTVRAIQRSLGVAACYVTHDQEEALGIADRVLVMRGGNVLQTGTPEEIYHRPRTAFVAAFVGLSNLLREDGRLLFFRPESVVLNGSEGDGTAAEVVESSYRGDRWLVSLRTPERQVLAYSPTRREAGETVRFRIEPPPVAVEDDEVGR